MSKVFLPVPYILCIVHVGDRFEKVVTISVAIYIMIIHATKEKNFNMYILFNFWIIVSRKGNGREQKQTNK